MSNNNMMLNKCTRCLQLKSYDMFSKDKSNKKKGIRSRCKQCVNELDKIYRENNRDSYLDRRKLYYQKNAQKFRLQRYIHNFTEFNNKHKIIDNHITIEDINEMKDKQNNKCFSCKCEMTLSCKDVEPNLLLVYRNKYELGYIKDNCVLLCYSCYEPLQKSSFTTYMKNKTNIVK